jgi:hypothetical protein
LADVPPGPNRSEEQHVENGASTIDGVVAAIIL